MERRGQAAELLPSGEGKRDHRSLRPLGAKTNRQKRKRLARRRILRDDEAAPRRTNH